MRTPLILGFEPGESLTATNSINIIIGGGIGKATFPIVPLEFTEANIKNALGGKPESPVTDSDFNEKFYDKYYSGLPSPFQRKFWGKGVPISKDIILANISLSFLSKNKAFNMPDVIGGKITSWALKGSEALANRFYLVAASKIASWVKGKIYSVISSGAKGSNLDALQSSTSSNSMLHGMNGRDTYNFDISNFKSGEMNICIFQGAITAVTGLALNIMFIGNFKKFDYASFLKLAALNNGSPYPIVTFLSSYYLDVFNKSFAWAVVADASIGIQNFPGAQAATMVSV